LIGLKFAAGQRDRRNPACRTIVAQLRVFAAAQHQIGQHDVDRSDRQERGRFGAVFTRRHVVTEIVQDAGDEFAN